MPLVLQHFDGLKGFSALLQEFVHSDEGRTQPHLASLLGLSEPAEILSLDVLQVHMDFL
jgi:tRNA U54 and U55 pseudouridine synthase Pus10